MTDRSDIVDGNSAIGRKYGLIYTKRCGWIDLGHAMGRKRLLKAGVLKKYDVKKGLNDSQKKSVALSIFLDVSHAFENLQSNWLFRLVTDSGYSAEDLVSNLIGFYRAVYPSKQFISLCQPVSCPGN